MYKTHQRYPGERDRGSVRTQKLGPPLKALPQVLHVAYTVCGIISIGDFEHGDIVVFFIFPSAVSTLEAQEQHQAAYNDSQD